MEQYFNLTALPLSSIVTLSIRVSFQDSFQAFQTNSQQAQRQLETKARPSDHILKTFLRNRSQRNRQAGPICNNKYRQSQKSMILLRTAAVDTAAVDTAAEGTAAEGTVAEGAVAEEVVVRDCWKRWLRS